MRFEARETATKSRFASKYIASFAAIREIQNHIIQQAREFNIPVIGDLTIEESVKIMYDAVIKKIDKLVK